MKPARTGHHGTYPRASGPIPVSLLCSRLGESFELFSDRTEDDIERDTLIGDFVAMHDAESAADDYR